MTSISRLQRAELALAALALSVALLGLIAGLDALRFHATLALVGAPAGGSVSFGAGEVVVVGLAVVYALVSALGARSLWRQLRAHRTVLRGLTPVACRDLVGHRVLVLADARPRAFCAGLLRPRVFVSHGALRLLTLRELHAVLAHEAHHARRRDPLRLMAARAVSEAFPFVPALAQLGAREAALAELAADAAALEAGGGDRASLASALLVFENWGRSDVTGIAPERVDQLLGERPRAEVSAALLASVALILAGLVALTVRVALGRHVDFGLPLAAAPLCSLAAIALAVVVASPAWLASRRAAQSLQPSR